MNRASCKLHIRQRQIQKMFAGAYSLARVHLSKSRPAILKSRRAFKKHRRAFTQKQAGFLLKAGGLLPKSRRAFTQKLTDFYLRTLNINSDRTSVFSIQSNNSLQTILMKQIPIYTIDVNLFYPYNPHSIIIFNFPFSIFN